ncbi:MAG: TetR/AcrR family transcriptional regulator [Naasia sp.]
MPFSHLTRDVIADAALRVSARADSFTLKVRDIGVELGVDPTAFYRHFRNHDELVLDLVDRLMARIHAQFVDDTGPWRSVLRRGAVALTDLFEAHPSVGIAAARDREVRQGELLLADLILSTILRSGVSEEDAVRLYSSLSNMTLASSALICEARISATLSAAEAVPVIASDSPVSDRRRWLAPAVPVDLSLAPTVARLWPSITALGRRDVFEASLDVCLDAIEIAARTR